MKLSDLKKSLAECHLTSDDGKLPFLLEVTHSSYFLNRVRECLKELDTGVNVQGNTKLAIQLLNIYRVIDKGVVGSFRD
jgi:hypothetical protein